MVERVLNELRPMIADLLAVEIDEIVAEARFFEDLGGESIDVLELAFRCEKLYGVKVPVQRLGGADVPLDDTGAPTAEAITKLHEQFPWIETSRLKELASAGRLTELFTVEAISRLVARAIAGRDGSSSPEAGGLSPAPG